MSNRYPGGLITKNPPALDPALGNAANGIYTLEQYLQAVKNATWPGFDPFFENTVLLLHGNGTNGAQNNTFLDSSTNNFTITRNGNTTQGTFSPFSAPDGYWSNFFDGTNDRLTIADNAALRPGTSNFTIEAWVYRAAAGAAHTIFAKGGASTGFVFGITSGNVLRFTHTTTNIDSTGTVAANTWVHVAVVREGTGTNQVKLYINGVADGQGTVSTNFNQTEQARIGEDRGETNDFNGYISNFRYVIGSALYTGNFTPSTSPFTTTSQGASSSEVELLTCQSNRFLDNSTNAFTVTPVNNVRVTPFFPFAPTAAYSPSVNGGSGYFDGSGDYLTVPAGAAFAPGTGDFTIEAWIYPTAGVERFIWAQTVSGTNYFLFFHTSTTASFIATASGGGTQILGPANSLNLNSWNHVAAVRSSGTVTVYVNGVAGTGTTNTTNLSDTTRVPTIGTYTHNTSSAPFTGYMSSLRYVNGTAIIPPSGGPTSPLTAVSGTSFLCNFTNAGIFDNTGRNNLETVNDAQIDTTTKKFGDGSMEFDGTTDYIVQPTSDNYGYGTGDFTIEFWVYFDDVNTSRTVVSNLSGSASVNPHLYIFNTTLRYYTNSADRITSSALSTSQWYHIALVRFSGSTKLYINGTQSGSTYTDTNNYGATAPLGIGTYWSAGSPFTSSTLDGFIDDLRITKGIARYTANFTPQTSQWQDQ
jgi:hypothetical protein